MEGLVASQELTTGETRKAQCCMRAGDALLSLSNKVRDISDQYAVLLRVNCNDPAIVGLRVDEFAEQYAGLAHDDILSHGQLLGVPPPVHPLAPCPSSKGAIGLVILTFWALSYTMMACSMAICPSLCCEETSLTWASACGYSFQ